MPALTILAVNFATYNGSRLFSTHRYHFDLTTKFDEATPFLAWTVLIYFSAFIFWVVNYIIAFRSDKVFAKRFVASEISAKIVCLATFISFPTTNVRPNIEGDGFFDNAMKLIYSIDPADNLFPSLHCLVSWFCYIAVRNNPSVPKWYKFASLIFALMIFVSTLTTKQHVIADVFSGVAIAELSWRIFTFIDSKKQA